jgi:TonB-dependent starch-binding outer membrane protein SusC
MNKNLRDCLPPLKATLKLIAVGMKLFILLAFVGVIQASASVHSQNNLISLKLENASVYEAVNEIANQMDLLFIFQETEAIDGKKINVNLLEATFDDAMQEVLKNSNLGYNLIENYIVVKPLETKVPANAAVPQQVETRRISGTVTSAEDGSTIPGVTVLVKGTALGTITDINGNYEIDVPEENNFLIFSFVGLETQEVAIDGRTVINVVMEAAMEALDEIVVVGYGTESKKLLTGSIGSVSSGQFKDLPTPTIDQALQGKTTGIQIIQNSGTPGGGMTVRIRGNSSISAGNQPLYVIDGIPVTTGDFGQIGFSGQTIDAVSDLNPNEIESISVLKDASAAAIYGARASNGVVLITTKRGQSQKTRINLSTYYGFKQPEKKLDMLDAKQWKEYLNDRAANDGGIPPYSPEDLNNNPVDTDWLDEIFRTAPTASVELSAVGGNERTQFFVSGNYVSEEGIIIGTSYERLNGRLNLDHRISDFVKIGASLGITYSMSNRVEGDQSLNGPLPNAITLPAIYPVYNSDGSFNESGPYANPVSIAEQAINWNKSFRNLGNIFADFILTKNLTFNTKWGFDYYNLSEHSYDPATTRQGSRYNGLGIDAGSQVMNLVSNNVLKYFTTINNAHNINVMLGYSFEKYNRRRNYIRGVDFPNENFQWIASAATIQEASSSTLDRGLNSWFGQVKYNFNNKYLFTGTFRADGSSKFGENNRYGFFPSASVAWRLSEEGFMENVSSVSDLKLRASYGLTGNDGIADFSSIGLYAGGYNYGGQSGIAPIQLPNPDLKWETTAQLNLGVDFSVFTERLTVNLDYYTKKTTDLLLERPIPSSSGYTFISANIGEMENKGFEIGFTGNILKSEDFKWDANLNISANRNKVTKLYNNQPISDIGRGGNRVEVGQPIGIFYGWRALGVDPSTGDIVFDDINSDGIITADDQTIIGDPHPDFIGGFNNNFSYKNWDLNVFLQFSKGNDIFNGSRIYIESIKGSDNQTTAVLDRWKQPGDITNIPRATQNDPNNNNRISSRFVEDGSYLRLKNVKLSYRFEKALVEKINLSSLNVYFTVQNMFTITKYTGMDPEVNYAGQDDLRMGTDFFTYPQAQTFIFGLNLGF